MISRICLIPLILTYFLAGTTIAAPNNQPRCSYFVDNFDNIPGAGTGRGIVNMYSGITYQAFDVAAKSAATGSTGGVIPHSGNQDIVAGVGNDGTQLGSVTLNPFGNTVASPSKSFDLYSFWFGCGSNIEQPLASTSIGCVLSATAYTIAGRQVPVSTFSYAPTNPTAAPMVQAVLPSSFRDLKNVTLGIASGTASSITSVIWLDDVAHCNVA